MSKRLITPTLVANTKILSKRYRIHDRDLEGFHLEVMPTGRKTYRIQSYSNGEWLFETIGDAAAMPLPEARVLAEERIAAFGNTLHDANTPFEVVAEISFRYRGRLWKPSTMRSCRDSLKRTILPYFRGKPIGSITRAEVEDWFTGLAGTPGTANRCLPIVSGIMRTAEDLGYIEEGSNPASGFRRYKLKLRERYLTDDEMARLGAVLEKESGDAPIMAAFIRLMTLTGCRRGELVNLKWAYYRQGHLYLPDSKTGPKTIFLSTPARKLLAELSRNSNSEWVFSQDDDAPRVETISKFWTGIRASAGITDMRMHDLRHNYASIAIRGGENIRVIGILLGHVDAETTLRYAHLDDESMQSAVNKVSKSMLKRRERRRR